MHTSISISEFNFNKKIAFRYPMINENRFEMTKPKYYLNKSIKFLMCVEMGFTWTFPRNQDVTVKLKSELIFITF